MTVAVIVMTDGRRQCIAESIPSLCENLRGDITRWFIHDDSGDDDYHDWLQTTYPTFDLITTHSRSGFAGAYRSARSWLRLLDIPERYIFSTEDDFTFNRPVQLRAMADVLDAHPHVVQLALRRQPWNDSERAAGGIVEQHPDDYADCSDGVNHWLEHRRHFTTNPSLFRRSLLDEGWPEGEHSEGRFGINLLEQHPDWRFAYWGDRYSGEAVTHIGTERVGVGY